jgi:DNA-binding MarR family transcriptional regulator
MTNDSSLELQKLQLAGIFRDFIRLRRSLHVKALVPENLAELKKRIGELRPEGDSRHAADMDLFYRVGIILSYRPEPMTMGDFSEALDVPLSTATRIVDWFVGSGYAERLSDPEDRRIVKIRLTETGDKMHQALNTFIWERVELLLRHFTPDERADLIRLARKLVDNLECLA